MLRKKNGLKFTDKIQTNYLTRKKNKFPANEFFKIQTKLKNFIFYLSLLLLLLLLPNKYFRERLIKSTQLRLLNCILRKKNNFSFLSYYKSIKIFLIYFYFY